MGSNGENKKKYHIKIKYFSCHQFGHYTTKFTKRKKGYKKDHIATFAEILSLIQPQHLLEKEGVTQEVRLESCGIGAWELVAIQLSTSRCEREVKEE